MSNSTIRGNQYGASIDDSGLTLNNSIVDRNDTGVYCADAYCHMNGNSISNNKIGASNGFVGSFVMTKNVIRGNDAFATIEQNVAFFNGDGFLQHRRRRPIESEYGAPEPPLGDERAVRRRPGREQASGNGNNPQCVGVVCQ